MKRIKRWLYLLFKGLYYVIKPLDLNPMIQMFLALGGGIGFAVSGALLWQYWLSNEVTRSHFIVVLIIVWVFYLIKIRFVGRDGVKQPQFAPLVFYLIKTRLLHIHFGPNLDREKIRVLLKLMGWIPRKRENTDDDFPL